MNSRIVCLNYTSENFILTLRKQNPTKSCVVFDCARLPLSVAHSSAINESAHTHIYSQNPIWTLRKAWLKHWPFVFLSFWHIYIYIYKTGGRTTPYYNTPVVYGSEVSVDTSHKRQIPNGFAPIPFHTHKAICNVLQLTTHLAFYTAISLCCSLICEYM